MGAAATIHKSEKNSESDNIVSSNNEIPSKPSTTYHVVSRDRHDQQSSIEDIKSRLLNESAQNTVAVVVISKSGFSKYKLSLELGQIIVFVWDNNDSTAFNVVQVIHDGECYRPVIGGICSGPVTNKGHYEYMFNMIGEYKFVSMGLKCNPLIASVTKTSNIEANLSNDKFSPNSLFINVNQEIIWKWIDCNPPLFMCQVTKCREHLGLKLLDKLPKATSSGQFSFKFKVPGIYYFIGSQNFSSFNLCIVEVKETSKDYLINVTDDEFEPSILVLEEGDRVWWSWDKDSCKNLHCIYQVESPEKNSSTDESYKPVKEGFRWPKPTKCGLLSHIFNNVGVYHYSDHNYQETAAYAGTIIVKPRPCEHLIEIKKEGFEKDLHLSKTGDRIWLSWNPKLFESTFNLVLERFCITPAMKDLSTLCKDDCKLLDRRALEICNNAGTDMYAPLCVGVYHFRSSNPENSLSTCSLVVSPGIRNYTIYVTENGFEPQLLTVHPNDRIWWIWQIPKLSLNVVQVKSNGEIMEGGFSSGGPMESPSAFMYIFQKPGVFYYSCGHKMLSKYLGIIIVKKQPTINQIEVLPEIIKPDPVLINVNDIVVWIFKSLEKYSLVEIKGVEQLSNTYQQSIIQFPRRCLEKGFDSTGIFHFTSKSFLPNKGKNQMIPDHIFSTVIVDNSSECSVIRVTSNGFFPSECTILKYESILWTWKNSSNEEHNIIHVGPDDHEEKNNFQHNNNLNSGKPEENSSFFFTFDLPGIYHVASVGAQGYLCKIHVLKSAIKSPKPIFEDKINTIDSSINIQKISVRKSHTIYIKCIADERPLKDLQIYYTIDGTSPLPHIENVKIYNSKKGLKLENYGIYYIRAMSVARDMLYSDLSISQQFLVLPNSNDYVKENNYAKDLSQKANFSKDHTENQLWLQCVPSIAVNNFNMGNLAIDIVQNSDKVHELIQSYNLFINGINYYGDIIPSCRSLLVQGFLSTKQYDICLTANSFEHLQYPKHVSNHLNFRVPPNNEDGGPYLSCFTTEVENKISLLWRNVTENPKYSVKLYQIVIDDEPSESFIKPQVSSPWCRISFEDCILDKEYKFQLICIPEDENLENIYSNELIVKLPINTATCTINLDLLESDLNNQHLPLEINNDDNEYIFIHEIDDYGTLSSSESVEEAEDVNKARKTKSSYTINSSYNSKEVSNDSLSDTIIGNSEFRSDSNYDTEHSKTDIYDQEMDLDSNVSLISHRQETSRGNASRLHSDRSSQNKSHKQKLLKRKKISKFMKFSSRNKVASMDFGEDYSKIQRGHTTEVDFSKSEKSRERKYPRKHRNHDGHKSSTDINSFSSKSTGEQSETVLEYISPTENIFQNRKNNNSNLESLRDNNNFELNSKNQLPVDIDATGKSWVNKFKLLSTTTSAFADLQKRTVKKNPNQLPRLSVSSKSEYEIEIKDESKSEIAHLTASLQPEKHNKLSKMIIQPTISINNFSYAKLQNQENDSFDKKDINPHTVTNNNNMPVPVLEINQISIDELFIRWILNSDVPKHLKVPVYNLQISGTQFKDVVNSDISYFEKDLITHIWNVANDTKCITSGLVPRISYMIHLCATFIVTSKQNRKQIMEFSTYSEKINYRLSGPPQPPVLSVKSIDIYQIILQWEVQEYDTQDLKAFYIKFNNQEKEIKLPVEEKNIVIDNIIDGQSLDAYVYAENHYGKSEKSNVISIKTSPKPVAPVVITEPTFNHGESIISWTQDSSILPQNFKIIFFRIFMDDIWHNDVTADFSYGSKNEKYNFVFQNLDYDASHEIKIFSVVGTFTSEENPVYCYSHSSLSTPLYITGFKPPEAALLHIETMNPKGILLGWDSPEENDDYHVIGYRILKNGSIYGSNMIPSSVNSLWIKDIMLGSRVELQLVTLTNINDNSNSPSSKIVIHYTGLVNSPTRFEVESVNGFGAVLVWNKITEKKHHFVPPDHFQITWWNSSSSDKTDIRSLSTKDSMVYITDLLPGTNYSAVLEGRCINNFKEIYEEKTVSCFKHKITVSSDPIKLHFKTSSPPSPPQTFCVLSATCTSIALQWDNPIEHGSEIVLLMILYSESSEKSLKYCKSIELTPDAKHAVINNISENTEYHFRLLAITQEYFLSLPSNFKRNNAGKLQFNEDGSLIGDTAWVVMTNVFAYTSGTIPPKNLSVLEFDLNKIKIEWTLPTVNGTNRLLSQVIRISEVETSTKNDIEEQSSICVNVDKYCNQTLLERLLPATLYRITVEAVVSIKTVLNIERFSEKFDNNDDDNRRTVHYPCKAPLFARTKINKSPPQYLACSKIVDNTIYVNWQAPVMYTTVLNEMNKESVKFIRHRLEGYRVYINNKLHATLKSSIVSVKLTKCKIGKNLIRISSLINPIYMPKIDHGLFLSNLEENMPKVLGLDESFSDELTVNINSSVPGAVTTLISNLNVNNDKYDIDLNWEIFENSNVSSLKQFSVSCFHENTIIKQVLDKNARMTKFTNLFGGFYYTLQVDSLSSNLLTQSTNQKVQVNIPGIPKCPLLSCKKLTDESITVEWTDLYDTNEWKIKSFQIFINDSSIAKELENSERSALITLKNSNHYKICLCVRLQVQNEQLLTEFSNPIYVSTGPKRRLMSQMEYDKFNNMRVLTVTESEIAGNFICLSTVQSNDTNVVLVWTVPQSILENVTSYQIVWKCIQGFEEQKIFIPNSKIFNYEIENLIPGLKYSFCLIAYDRNNSLIERSKQLFLETNTILEAPILQLKASNFSYATICWTNIKPKGNVKMKCFYIFINGLQSAEIDPNTCIFTYFDGQPCHQYSFHCQTISYEEKYNSKPSNSVKCIWPGCISPSLTKLIPMTANSIRISWVNPTLSDGAKIKHFRITCSDSESGELIQAVNFIHPESRESEIQHVKSHPCFVRLETYLHGAPYPYLSEQLLVTPETGPEPPIIQVKLLNIDERIETISKLRNCINEEDTIIRCIHYWGSQNYHTSIEQSLFLRASTLLSVVQNEIDNYVHQVSNHEDYIIAELKWNLPQASERIKITGFKVLVDGKYYGRELDSKCKSILIKLNVDSKNHKIAMISVTQKPRLLSDLSNVVEVLTDLYPVFRYFCRPDLHAKSTELSKCPFKSTLIAERKKVSKNHNPEFSVKPVTCPILSLHGQTINESVNFPRYTNSINCVLFWMPNCENSVKCLHNFLQFAAEELNKNFIFSTIAYVNFSVEIQSKGLNVNDLLSKLQQKDNIQHYYCLDNENNFKENSDRFQNAFKILDIRCVPFILLINNENKIIYRGRYCADEYTDIKYFLSSIIQKAFHKSPYDPLDDWQKTREYSLVAGFAKSSFELIKKDSMLSANLNEVNANLSKSGKGKKGSIKSQQKL